MQSKRKTKWVNKDKKYEKSDGGVEIHIVGKSLTQPICVEVLINSKPLSVEMGAANCL